MAGPWPLAWQAMTVAKSDKRKGFVLNPCGCKFWLPLKFPTVFYISLRSFVTVECNGCYATWTFR